MFDEENGMEIALQRIEQHTGFVDLCHLGLTELPALPNNIKSLWCNGNRLTSLPPLPRQLTQLRCDGNQLTSLPLLPPGLRLLRCDANSIEGLPALPEPLRALWCHQNRLTTLPNLPPHLGDLLCDGNQIPPLLPQESPHSYERRLREHESKTRTIHRVAQFKEDLMINRWHPSRVEKLLNVGLDIEDM